MGEHQRASHAAPRPASAPTDAGISVIEVVVALTIFGVLTAAVLAGVLSAVTTSRANEARVVAANLAARQVEAARGLEPSQVVDTSYTTSVDGREYTVVQTTAYDTVRGTGSACAGASGPAAFKRVSVAVTWPGMGAVQPVRSDTLRSLPITGLADGTGVVSVPVRDRAANPLVGVPVRLDGPSGSVTASTRADGCSVFAGLAPSASYAVSLDVPGWVDPTGAPAPSRSGLLVNAGQVTKDPGFTYDRAVTIDVTLAAPAGHPLPTRDLAGMSPTISLIGLSAAPAGQPATSYPRCGSAVPCAIGTAPGVARLAGLFPHSAGWSVWGGTCLPSSRPSSPTTTAPEPGATVAVTSVALGGTSARVRTTTGTYLTGTLVHAVNAACPGEVYAFPLTTGTAAVKLALPVGTWRLVVDPTQWNTSGRYRQVSLTSGSTTSIQDVPA